MMNLIIAGYGELASSVYVPAIDRLDGRARLAGVVELDSRRRSAAEAALPGIPIGTSLDQLLTTCSADGVLISTPPTRHADLAVEAFERGLAVYVEKPLAASRSDGERILRAWQKSGAVGMVGFNYRFNSIIQDLERALQAEEIGPVVAVRTYFGLATDEIPPWKQKRETGGGALLDLASHHIDLLRFLFHSEIRCVNCRIWSDRYEDDNAILGLTLESGVEAQIQVSLSSVEEDRIEVFGRTGKLIYDRYYSERLLRTGRRSGQVRPRLLLNRLSSFVPGRDLRDKLRSPMREPSYPRSLGRFVEAIASGESRRPNIEDGWRCLQVILAAEEAHGQSRTQSLMS